MSNLIVIAVHYSSNLLTSEQHSKRTTARVFARIADIAWVREIAEKVQIEKQIVLCKLQSYYNAPPSGSSFEWVL